MNAQEIIKNIENAELKSDITEFNVGDTIKVHAKIKEGNRERIQVFEGTVLKIQGGSVPPLEDLFKMAGMELPSYLKGKVDDQTAKPEE